jgi:hypothetical protein
MKEESASKSHDVFLRAHTVGTGKASAESWKDEPVPKWPRQILLFDSETTIDTRQDLTFGAYRRCELIDGKYLCSEEGLFYRDGLDIPQRTVLERYAKREPAGIEAKSFPPRLDLQVYSRSKFVEKIFWKTLANDGMVVGFNLPFDLSRLAVDWRTARNSGWSLILSERRSRKTGKMEPNPNRPRIRLAAPFISLLRPEHPEEWPRGRFLDVHTLAFALFDEGSGLDELCEKLGIPGKIEHDPTGRVTRAEIDYCRADVRATNAALNELKKEFDLHPLEELRPDRVYSPASLAKAYLDEMGIVPPKNKFDVPDKILGIAMQAYYGGRAECRVRRVPVPVVHTDFKSQYPTVNTLLENWRILTAKTLSVEDATDDVRKFLNAVTLADLYNPSTWKRLSFFALVRPDRDILPVRTVYNGFTQNIGINELTSNQPIWFAGPDVVKSAILTGRVPHIEKAIRMVPHGKQVGLKATSLRGMVAINPRQQDFFRYVVEQRERQKSNEPLADFLKVLANAGSYGLFVEVNPEKLASPTMIEVFSGEVSFEQRSNVIEKHGRWYFPPLAALITAGGRLLLGMLEQCVANAGGTYLFCDTDSLCIIGSKHGELVPCLGGIHKLPDEREAIKALSRKYIRDIGDSFRSLNPYDPSVVPDILKIESVNFDSAGQPRQLSGYAISAKRYALFQQSKDKVTVIEPKAHGLGYLYPPIEKKNKDDPHWTFETWNWMLRQELGFSRTAPGWIDLPAMMRIVVSTPHVLGRFHHLMRPYNFLFCPLTDKVAGHPANVDPNKCTPITAFTKDRTRWARAECINVRDGARYRLALKQSSKLDKLIPQTFGYVLRLYLQHPEAKSLAPDGTTCAPDTRGLLKRSSIVAGHHRYVGKETDRRWTEGEDPSLITFAPVEYLSSGKVAADANLRRKVADLGMRELMRRTGFSQHTIQAIRDGRPVRRATLKRLQIALDLHLPVGNEAP